jgi:hypothetical protein
MLKQGKLPQLARHAAPPCARQLLAPAARPAPHLLKHVVDACLVVVLARVLVVTASVGVIQRHKVVAQEDLAAVEQALQQAAHAGSDLAQVKTAHADQGNAC